MAALRFVGLLWMAGCGRKLDPEGYLVDFTDQYCAIELECTDPAQLAFEGSDSIDLCVATNGPRFAEQWGGCVLDRKNAVRCLSLLPDTQCPDEGDLDSAIPAECFGAWQKCIGGGTPVVPE
jgi:hypothetical protein